jgi:hypothetical protein
MQKGDAFIELGGQEAWILLDRFRKRMRGLGHVLL